MVWKSKKIKTGGCELVNLPKNICFYGKDVVKFQSMWLRRVPDDPQMVQALLPKLIRGTVP